MGARWWPPALRFEPYPATEAIPNVVVDGSANAGTVLVLSHWPHAPCPAELVRDLSAGSAMAYLDHRSLHGPAEVVTNNHFDQDGLMSVYALVDPEAALARADLVTEVARAGDFAVTTSRAAARVSMAIAACADAERSPLGSDLFGDDHGATTGALYTEVLPRVTGWLDDLDTCHELWADEDAQLTADEALMSSGAVRIEEVGDLDLTVVTLPDTASSAGGHRFGGMWESTVHPMALYGAVGGFAVLLVQGARVELRYRYESWVQFRSRPVRPRVDLAPLAEELTALEPGPARWSFDGVGALTPTLHVDGEGTTDLDPAVVERRVEHALRQGSPAWDPYALA